MIQQAGPLTRALRLGLEDIRHVKEQAWSGDPRGREQWGAHVNSQLESGTSVPQPQGIEFCQPSE